jgi:hypothetical protein
VALPRQWQLVRWSLTNPAACMKAYMIVGPTKVIPSFFSAALSASDSGVLHRHTGGWVGGGAFGDSQLRQKHCLESWLAAMSDTRTKSQMPKSLPHPATHNTGCAQVLLMQWANSYDTQNPGPLQGCARLQCCLCCAAVVGVY